MPDSTSKEVQLDLFLDTPNPAPFGVLQIEDSLSNLKKFNNYLIEHKDYISTKLGMWSFVNSPTLGHELVNIRLHLHECGCTACLLGWAVHAFGINEGTYANACKYLFNIDMRKYSGGFDFMFSASWDDDIDEGIDRISAYIKHLEDGFDGEECMELINEH